MLVEANAYQYDSVHEKAAQGAEKEYWNNCITDIHFFSGINQ